MINEACKEAVKIILSEAYLQNEGMAMDSCCVFVSSTYSTMKIITLYTF
jgi:hypothetical protein